MVKTKLFTSLAKINKTTMSSLDLHENAAFRNTQTLICVLSIWFSKPTKTQKSHLARLPLQVLWIPRLPWSLKKGNTFWGTADSRKPGEMWNFNHGNSLSKNNK